MLICTAAPLRSANDRMVAPKNLNRKNYRQIIMLNTDKIKIIDRIEWNRLD